MDKINVFLLTLILMALSVPAYSQAKTSHDQSQKPKNKERRYGGFENHRSFEISDEKPIIKESAASSSKDSQKKARKGQKQKQLNRQKTKVGHAAAGAKVKTGKLADTTKLETSKLPTSK